jgi:uncharacterized protein HemX
MYKNKLVVEVNKEVEKENEAKALEAKKQKIRQMLSIIKDKENDITEREKMIEEIKKQVFTLKEQLEKEDFSFLNDWTASPYANIIEISVDNIKGMTCTATAYNPKY